MILLTGWKKEFIDLRGDVMPELSVVRFLL